MTNLQYERPPGDPGR